LRNAGYFFVRGSGTKFCNDKSGDWDKEEMRVMLYWHLTVYLIPLTISLFSVTVFRKYLTFRCLAKRNEKVDFGRDFLDFFISVIFIILDLTLMDKLT